VVVAWEKAMGGEEKIWLRRKERNERGGEVKMEKGQRGVNWNTGSGVYV
jgi:hypothetical protein